MQETQKTTIIEKLAKNGKTIGMVAKYTFLFSIALLLWYFSQIAGSMFDSNQPKQTGSPILLYGMIVSFVLTFFAIAIWVAVQLKNTKKKPIKESVLLLLISFIVYAVTIGEYPLTNPIVSIPFVIAFILLAMIFAQLQIDKLAKLKKREEATNHSNFGKFLYGLSEKPCPSTYCLNKKNVLLWVDSRTLNTIGKIQKTSITKIFVEDKSTATKRITATRLVAIGIFALAFQKNKSIPAFYLIIEFADGNLINQAYFEFQNAEKANQANQDLRKYLKGIIPISTPESMPPAPNASSSQVPPDDVEVRLTKIKNLKAKGLITEDEYQDKRTAILENV